MVQQVKKNPTLLQNITYFASKELDFNGFHK